LSLNLDQKQIPFKYGAQALSVDAKPKRGNKTTGNNAVTGKGMGSVAQNIAISKTT
jgi:hypothetical protein